jgi:hypothetical protein
MRDYRLVKNYDDAAVEDEETPKKSSGTTVVVSSAKSSKLVPLTILTVALVGGGLLLYFILRNKSGTDSSKVELQVESLQEFVNAGEDVSVNATLTNVSDGTISPKLRLDIKHGTGGNVTVNENSEWTAFGEMEPGEVVTKQLSMTVPGNWTPGWQIYGRVVLEGTQGTIYDQLIATIPGGGGQQQEYLYITPLELKHIAVPYGGMFQFDIECDNRMEAAMPVNFYIGFRDQSYLSIYSDIANQKSVPVGTSIQTLTSAKANFNGSILDIRVIVAGGANIVTPTSQGEISGKGTLIFEEPSWVYAGDSKLRFTAGPLIGGQKTYLIPQPSTRTPADGRINNGMIAGATFVFDHIGPEETVKCGLFLKTNAGTTLANGYKGSWIQASFILPESKDWTQVSCRVTGPAVIPSSLLPDKEISCYAGVCKSTETLNSNVGVFTPATGLSFWTK